MKNEERRSSGADSAARPSPCCSAQASTPPAASRLDELQVLPRSGERCHSTPLSLSLCVCECVRARDEVEWRGGVGAGGTDMCAREQTQA